METLKRAREVFRSEVEAVEATEQRLGRNFEAAVEKLAACAGRVVITGMGKSGIIGRKIAATLSSTGTPAFFLHPAEAVHGDLGVIARGDVVLAISNSGKTDEVLRIMPSIRKIGAVMIAITGDPDSPLAAAADLVLEIRAVNEADPFDVIPTASTTALLVLGDALALCTLERKGFQRRDYAFLHPAGALGQQLTRLVDDLMRPASKMPRVSEGTPLSAALKVMSRGDLGLVVVTGAGGRLAGILTDGDLRRHLIEKDSIKDFRVEDLMTRKPKTIKAGSLAVNAVRIMEKHEITALIVVDRGSRPVGVLHLHGILGGKRLYGKS